LLVMPSFAWRLLHWTWRSRWMPKLIARACWMVIAWMATEVAVM
jgi:hypothetical protein